MTVACNKTVSKVSISVGLARSANYDHKVRFKFKHTFTIVAH
jgi:hypothetical protein